MEPKDRLQEARRAAGFAGPAEAAHHFGWKLETYKAHESGKRGIRVDPAQQYGRAYRVDAEWILYGRGKGPVKRNNESTNEPDIAMPDTELLRLSISFVLNNLPGRTADELAKAVSALYRVLLERQQRGELISDRTAAQALLDELMRLTGG